MASVSAGVDLGGTKIQAVVVRGEAVAGSHRVPTPQSGDVGEVVETIAQTVHASLEAAGASVSDLAGVGIGAPGEIDQAGGVVMHAANVPGFGDRVEIGPLLSAALGVPAFLDNDVSVGVLGEFRRGAGRPYRNLLGVWVGTGVGGGLILDGELYDGRGAGGEIGHVAVKNGGRRCPCGLRGCLEAYAGRAGMEKRARRLVKRGRKTVLFKIMKERGRTRLTSGVFAEALDRNDKMARELIDEAIDALGLAIASSQNLLDLEAIIVGGGLGDRLGRPFVDRVEKALTKHLFVQEKPPVILTSQLGDLSGAVGASLLVPAAPARSAPARKPATRSRRPKAPTPPPEAD